LSAKSLLILAFLATPAFAQVYGSGMVDPNMYHGLAEDRRAHRVGDTLTILVVETSRASAAANTGASNDVELSGNLRTNDRNRGGGISLSGSDNGAGQTSRTGQVQAQLAVRVVGIDDAGGTLRIHGEQAVIVNGETQRIALDGAVRAEDIGANNTLASNRISEARIEFTGRGDVSAPQKRSIIYRFTKWLGLI
jgi:flagellar L-ring protein FlgH